MASYLLTETALYFEKKKMTGVGCPQSVEGGSLICSHLESSTVREMLGCKVDVWGCIEILQMLIFNECRSHKQS